MFTPDTLAAAAARYLRIRRTTLNVGDVESMSQSIDKTLAAYTPQDTQSLLMLAGWHFDLFTAPPRSLGAARRSQAKTGTRPALDTPMGLVQLNVREFLLAHLLKYAQETWGWDPAAYTDERGTTYRMEAEEKIA
jgi:hypothetical protein